MSAPDRAEAAFQALRAPQPRSASKPARLEHVFSNIPNDRRHRAAIEALRPFLNRADYRMRVRGRGPKSPEDISRFGSIKLSGAKRLSIYFDSNARAENRSALWQRIAEAKKETERCESARQHLETVAMLAEESARHAAAELAKIPAWIRFLCMPVSEAWARLSS